MTDGVVAIVAHPDDEALIAGGTLALAAAAGVPTGIVSLTRGELGPISDAALATPATLGLVRERELAASAAELGVDWGHCLRHPDGELPWSDFRAVAGELVELLDPAPAVVLTFAPDGLYGHPDHVATSAIAARAATRLSARIYEAAWDPAAVGALVAAAQARGLPASLWGLEPEAFGTAEPPPAVRIDVRPVLHRKLRALRAHRTQLAGDHLFAALPDDLASGFLGEEAWWTRTGDGPDPLERLLAHG